MGRATDEKVDVVVGGQRRGPFLHRCQETSVSGAMWCVGPLGDAPNQEGMSEERQEHDGILRGVIPLMGRGWSCGWPRPCFFGSIMPPPGRRRMIFSFQIGASGVE
jgi:hypothetical protein